jgi:cob(I)alamin adenosyltransferase
LYLKITGLSAKSASLHACSVQARRGERKRLNASRK